jgi:glycine/D-amino acid oxidase-like deaminating enzyme
VNNAAANYWEDSAPPRAQAAATLGGGERFDVAVVGAGFCGLWTAFHLLEQDASLSIAVLERERVGFGASGRNGGFASPKLGPLHQMLAPGAELGAAAYRAGIAALAGIRRVVEDNAIACDFRDSGLLCVATNEVQRRRIRREVEAAERMGLDSVRGLDQAQVQERVRSPLYLAATEEDNCAILHPLKLARGIADLLAERGVRIVEHCAVRQVTSSRRGAHLDTSSGPVEAGAVVMCVNAWAPEHRAFRRDLVAVHNYVVATEPLDTPTWQQIWPSGRGMSDKRFYPQYYRPTADGRIVWGGRDAPISYASRFGPGRDRDDTVFAALRQAVRTTFPELKEVRFTHAWGGAIDVTPAFVPRVGTLPDAPVHFGHGFNGQGVCASFAVGDILAHKALGRAIPDLPYYATHAQGRFPVEPLRSLGAALIRREMLHKDRRADEGRTVRRTTEPLLLRAGIRLYGRTSRLAPRTAGRTP